MRSPELPQTISNSLYFEEVNVKLSQGIEFAQRLCSLDFKSTTQDVLSSLGPPSRIFYKDEDKMKIHTNSYSGLGCEDYFYNYFALGVDILFDVQKHVVKKFILHTNFPCHHEFNRYVKCNFIIRLPIPNHNDKDKKAGLITVHPDSKWPDIQPYFGVSGKPVVHNQSSANPFGATLFYGYKNVIFEVMQNSYIASVCLFSSSN